MLNHAMKVWHPLHTVQCPNITKTAEKNIKTRSRVRLSHTVISISIGAIHLQPHLFMSFYSVISVYYQSLRCYTIKIAKILPQPYDGNSPTLEYDRVHSTG